MKKKKEEKLKIKIIKDYLKFFRSTEKKYGRDLYFEYIGFRLLINAFKRGLKKKEIAAIITEAFNEIKNEK